MLDCLDKQQHSQQQLDQDVTRQEPLFWARPLQHQYQQRLQTDDMQHMQLAPSSTSSYAAGTETAANQQTSQKKPLLVDIDQAGQPDKLADASSTVQQQQQQQQQSANNELIGYYFGSISRETSEWILKNHGNRLDGAYLLRSSGPKDDFVLSLMVVHGATNADASSSQTQPVSVANSATIGGQAPLMEVLHYKIVETDDSFVALHGQVGDEKFATIDELIEKAQGVATKPKWPIQRQSLESQILPPTFWGLTVDQIYLAILIKAKQWGFPLSIFQQPASTYQAEQQQLFIQQSALAGGHQTADGETVPSPLGQTVTTLDNETIRTLIYKSLHEFQPWFHGRIGRDEAERRIEEGLQRDGRFLVRERDNFSYAMCISHKRTTKHYRIDVLSTGELAIQDGRKFTSLMALVSHYTIMSDGLWCALTEPCPRPIQQANKPPMANQQSNQHGRFPSQICTSSDQSRTLQWNNNSNGNNNNNNDIYCVPPSGANTQLRTSSHATQPASETTGRKSHQYRQSSQALMCPNQSAAVLSIKAPIKEWLHTINHKWSQLIASKTNQQHQSLNSFLFGSSNPLNNHCRHKNHHHHGRHHQGHRRGCKNGCSRHQRETSQNDQNKQHNNRMAANKNPSQQQQLMMNGTCNCLALNVQSSLEVNPHNPQTTMLQNKSALESGSFSRQPLTAKNNMNQLQLDHLAPSQARALDQTKALLSCLPQNAGFMLDSQSFIGSPLFVVKPSSQAFEMDAACTARLNSVGDVATKSSCAGGGGNNSSAERFANNVEKLISPAQSISANLNLNLNPNGYQQSNPYALNTDIYGSQTSTAIVNDQLMTSSSSSSGHNKGNEQRQAQSNVNPKHTFCHRNSTSTQQSSISANSANNNNSRPIIQGDGARFITPFTNLTHATFNQQTTQPEVRRSGNQNNAAGNLCDQARLAQGRLGGLQPSRGVPPHVQHAGPILCGQHAGPAYRYTNCASNEDSAFKPCLHSAALGLSNIRAVDDLHLATPSTQLAGPAALTKFVQFQDGQCLRTHRDTKSIQMAYLLSRQEALNVLNSRNSARLQQAHSTNQQQQQQQTQQNHSTAGQRFKPTPSRSNVVANNNHGLTTNANDHLMQNGTLANQQQQSADFDLIDCDGSGFQFKYDPKLIKSSSIETLCGAGDDEDDDDANIIEDLSHFKTNSELLMSLQPYWSASGERAATSYDLGFSPLVPIQAGLQQQQQQQPPQLQQADEERQKSDLARSNNNQTALAGHQFEKSDCNLASLLYDSARNNDHNEQLFNESWNRKHNLDELTTSTLAELTASLKAQVDLKKKRQGLCTSGVASQDSARQSDGLHAQSNGALSNYQAEFGEGANKSSQTSRILESDPLELINEFDTLIGANNR